jgi:hypothetical protein
MKNKLIALMCAAMLIQAVGLMRAQADFVAYNDCVHAGSPPNATNYSAYMGDGGGFETPSGLLRDYATGNWTSVTATLTGANISGSTSGAPLAGTDAYNVFNGKVYLGDWSTSYNSSASDWYYQVTFTGLDLGKTYEFVTTANRDSSSYTGDGSSSRWTKFSIIGADTYTNSSSVGVVEISEDVVRMNTGYNTVNGYVARWTGITAADGSFTVISENVGAGGPGEPIKSYGMEGFMLTEVPVSPTVLLLGSGLVGLLIYRRRRAAPRRGIGRTPCPDKHRQGNGGPCQGPQCQDEAGAPAPPGS